MVMDVSKHCFSERVNGLVKQEKENIRRIVGWMDVHRRRAKRHQNSWLSCFHGENNGRPRTWDYCTVPESSDVHSAATAESRVLLVANAVVVIVVLKIIYHCVCECTRKEVGGRGRTQM